MCACVPAGGAACSQQAGGLGLGLGAVQTERVREGGVWEAPGGDVSCYFGFAGPSFSFDRDLDV